MASNSLMVVPSGRFGRIRAQLELQRIVIGALMMREVHTRYGRENLGFLWLFLDPMILCTGVMGIWWVMHGSSEHGVPILAFCVTGYMPLVLWRHVINRAVHCFRANGALLYHRQIRVLDLLLSRFLLEIYGAMIAFSVIAFIFWAIGLYQPPKDLGLFYLGWLYFILFTSGLGLIIGPLTEMVHWAEKIVGPFMYFSLPVCGVFFMVEWLPAKAQRVLEWVPTVNAYEMIRGGQFGSGVHPHYDIGYMTLVCVATVSLGLYLTHNVHRHLIIE